MITFFDILRLHKIDPSKVRLVRHSNGEIEDIYNTYLNDNGKFEAYQSFQEYRKFMDAKHLAVFISARGTTSLFLGIWDIKNNIENKALTGKLHDSITKHKLPSIWHKTQSWYDHKRNPVLDEYSERLVIDWGKAALQWVQKQDKPIVEIKAKNSIGDFVSYDNVQLSYDEIKKLAKDADSNQTWVNALSTVNGIYLIRDAKSGKLYVGSACGNKKIWGRWCDYARTGHGGNKELKGLDANNFIFSILEIVPRTFSEDNVYEREQKWMEKLGTREKGLNN